MQAPIEVFEAVIDGVSDDPASLHCLSLTCSAFLPRTRYHLFSCITIRSVQRMEACSQFLESYSWLLPLVRKVTLSVSIPEGNTHRNLRLLDVVPVHLLSHLPNLHSWTMETTRHAMTVSIEPSLWLHRSALWRYRKYGGCIRNLEVAHIRVENVSSFAALLSAFIGIHTLNCSCIELRERDDRSFVDSSESMTNALSKPLAISNLIAGPNLNAWVNEYLLASSATTLSHLDLTITLQFDDTSYFERLMALLSRFTHLSSLILRISIYHSRVYLPLERNKNSPDVARDLRAFTRLLKHLKRDRLEYVRLALKLEPVAALGCYLSFDSPLLQACKALEEELLTFPSCGINVYDATTLRRLGRTEFWSRAINGAFPKLNQQGLFSFTRTRTIIPDPFGHEGGVTCLVASHDNKQIITGSEDGTIIVWDTEHGKPLCEWFAAAPARALALSPDGKQLLCAGYTSGCWRDSLLVWDIGDGSDGARKVATLENEGIMTCACCTWSSDGALIASVSSNGRVCVWDAQTFQRRDSQANCPPLEDEPLLQFTFSPDSRYLAWRSGGSAACCVFQPFADKSPVIYLRHPHPIVRWEYVVVNAFSFDSDSRRIATAHGSWGTDPPEAYVVRIWDVATGTPLLVLGTPAQTQPLCAVSFAPDGRSVLSASSFIEGFVKIWDTESGEQKTSLSALLVSGSDDGATFNKAVFSPNGKYIAIASTDLKTSPDYRGTVQLWKVIDASCVAEFTEHGASWISHVAFSPNGEFLASADSEGMVYIRRLSRFVE